MYFQYQCSIELKTKYNLKSDTESINNLGMALCEDIQNLFKENYKNIRSDLTRWSFIPTLGLITEQNQSSLIIILQITCTSISN